MHHYLLNHRFHANRFPFALYTDGLVALYTLDLSISALLLFTRCGILRDGFAENFVSSTKLSIREYIIPLLNI